MPHSEDNSQLIDQCQQLLTDTLSHIAKEMLDDIDTELEQNIAKASSNQANIKACEDANLFHVNKKAISDCFCQTINEGFIAFKDNSLFTQIKENDFQNSAWSLLDDDILEETICLSTLSSETKLENQEKLWQVDQRLSVLNNNIEITEHNNPLSPVQFFIALRSALRGHVFSITTKLTAYKALSHVLQQQYPTILNKTNAFFISKHILPDLTYETKHNQSIINPNPIKKSPKKNSREKERVDENSSANPSSKNTQTTPRPIVDTIRNLLRRARNINHDSDTVPIAQQSHLGKEELIENNESTPTHQPSHNSVVFDASQIVEAVEEVQNSAATAHFFSAQQNDDILLIPTNIAENSARVYNQLHKASPNGSIDAKNMYTIDMVGMLFEYILADENLPDSIKTLLSHLHTPFLKLAFLDSDFFDNKEHKSRMLLDSLAEAGANWVHHDGTAQYDMYNEIKQVVQRAVKEFKNDVNLFAELLMEFNLLKKRVSHMHNLRERNSIEKKQGQEKHEQAKSIARQEIKKRIEGRRVPSSIISLLSPWFTYLTFIQLKEGQSSKGWKDALNVIDNLITYCSIKTVKQDTSLLAEGFDTIIMQVKQGLTHVAYNETKSESILNELEELKNSVLNKKAIRTTTATDTSTKNASNNNENHDSPTVEEERVMNYIKLIEPGTWVEYDNKTRLKVSGFSSEAKKYILVDQSSQEVTMVTRLAFARDILAERATIIDGTAKPLFERALERIHHNLDKQVQASTIQ
jgi:hypothetical protein